MIMFKSNTPMFLIFHSLWNTTSTKLNRRSIQWNKHVSVFPTGQRANVLRACIGVYVCAHLCVCACVWLVPVATVWLYQWERLFESLCGLFFFMLTNQCFAVCAAWTRGYTGTCMCTHVRVYLQWSLPCMYVVCAGAECTYLQFVC